MIVLLAWAGVEAGQFGTRCQKTFENNWQNTVSYVYARCGRFNDELDDSDTKRFYYNLVGGTTGFTTNDGSLSFGGIDTVDLFYVDTHGGKNDTDALLTFWNEDVWTSSSTWRFGDNADGARIFSQYSCKTNAVDDFSFARWINAFRGGLQISTGSHDLLWDGYTTDETGEDYADDLQDGKSVKWAWFDGNGDWYHDQDVAVKASGTSLDNCRARRDGLKSENLANFPRLRDDAIAQLCSSWITDN